MYVKPLWALSAAIAALGCGAGDGSGGSCAAPAGDPAWQVLKVCETRGQLLSVWGTGQSNVWVVGAGGQVLHFDGCAWTRPDSGTTADLWWVFGFEGGPVYFAGADGTVIKHEGGVSEAMSTGVSVTLFGIWGSSVSDLYAVGFDNDGGDPGAVLHFNGAAWSKVSGLPASVDDDSDFFKVWGRSADDRAGVWGAAEPPSSKDVWVVGRKNLILHFDGATWSDEASDVDTDWITVTGDAEDVVIVGGKSNGAIIRRAGDAWEDVSPDFIQTLQGVCLAPDGSGLAAGLGATFVRRDADGAWSEDESAPFDLFNPSDPPVEQCFSPTPDYHACFADGAGGLFAVGGNFFAPLTEGAIVYYGPAISTEGL